MPLGEDRTRARCKLHTRVQMVSELLVELMEAHRDELAKCVSLHLGQRSLGKLVLDVQPVKPAVLRQTPISQQRAH